MTPKRKEYLDNIGKEERAIRNALKYNKGYLKECKRICSLNGNYYRWKESMTVTKSIIKALKKQLPAPRKHYTDEVCDYIGCPICYFEIDKDYPCYCSECGKKLR